MLKILLRSLILFSLITLTTHANAFEVEVNTVKDRKKSFCSEVSIYNPSTTTQTWEITLDPKGTITKAWGVNYQQNPDTLETVISGKKRLKEIAGESTISFKYCAKKVAVTPSEGDLVITETKLKENEKRFCKRVHINNTTDKVIDWNINLAINGEISRVWNANYTQDPDTLELSANGVKGNNLVYGNDSVKFRYCAKKTETQKPSLELFNSFNLGFGGSYAFPFNSTTPGNKIWVSSVSLVLDDNIAANGYYANIKDFDPAAFSELQSNLKKSKFLVYWVTEGWQESWYNASRIQEAMDAGYIPVFNYWYWGDKLINGLPNEAQKLEYQADNERLVTFLNKMNGTKFLIMEPEFNKNVVTNSEESQNEFSSLIGDAIDRIKANTSDTYFSLAMTDAGSRGVNDVRESCGYDNCALGDKYTWNKPSLVYENLLEKLDFISFQQMVGQFSRDPSNPGTWDNPNPKAYTNEEIGIDYLAQRISNLSLHLKEKYNKPVFLPYMTVPTATWEDSNANNSVEIDELDYTGWEDKADNVYQELSTMKDELQTNGLFGFAPMALFDNPRHDYGGYQYFMQNEYHIGIMKSSAVDEVDEAINGDIRSKNSIVDNLFGTL